MIAIAPALTSVQRIVDALESHPNLIIRQQFVISSVTTCVNFANVYRQNWEYLPHFLDNLAWGWVQNVVVFGKDYPSPLFAAMQAANPDINIIRASSTGKVYRSQDLDLILSESWFNEPHNRVRRAVATSTPSAGHLTATGFCTIVVHIRVPLSRALMEQHLATSMTSSGVHSMKAKIRFTDAPSSLFDCSWLRGGKLTIGESPLPQPPPIPGETEASPSVVAFYGLKLVRDVMRDCLRACIEVSRSYVDIPLSTLMP